jgi:hypothetical protein
MRGFIMIKRCVFEILDDIFSELNGLKRIETIRLYSGMSHQNGFILAL